ncbi:MAG: baseplate J/gp47 family protein, partial [Acinetobacter sp.]
LYSNLDVDTASGVYLDSLCKLANVNRLPASKSTASLIVTNMLSSGPDVTFGDQDVNGNVLNQLTFVDKAGTEWISNVSITLAPKASAELNVTCTETGAVDAPANWIYETLTVMNLNVSQPTSAIRGNTQETDSELRQRRAQSSGANGIGILESLVGALLEISGINDVSIYNNNTLAAVTAKDGTSIGAHNIYVIIRLQEGLNVADATIGELIYNKLTPGINTTISTAVSANGIAKKYDFIPQMLGVAITFINRHVYWKQAKSINPTITTKITPTVYFTENEIPTIAQAVYDYTNNIKLGDAISIDQLFIEILEADPKFKSQRTYNVSFANVSVTETLNPDTYYHYSKVTFVKNADNTYSLSIS